MFHPPADQLAATSSSLSFTTHTTASSIFNEAYQHLTQTQAQEINTHVILSHILKLCGFEPSSQVPRRLLPSSPTSATSGTALSPSPPPLDPQSFWIAGWSGPPHSRSLRFIVSLTQGQIGQHPLFVVDLEPGTLSPPAVAAAMAQVAALLLELDPQAAERVFAVFGPRPWAEALSIAWCDRTNAMLTDEPNKAVNYMECTSLNPGRTPLPGHRVRRAGSDDVDLAARLCRDDYSSGCTLSLEDARQEARTLIAYNALFFYEVDTGSGAYCVTSMLGVGRSSEKVAGVTKVYTLPKFRRKGHASRLLNHVCSLLFNEANQSVVVSFVPFENNAYKRLVTESGFEETSSGYKEWVELGFQDVDVGHW